MKERFLTSFFSCCAEWRERENGAKGRTEREKDEKEKRKRQKEMTEEKNNIIEAE